MAAPLAAILPLIASLIAAVEHLIKTVNAIQESSRKNRAAYEAVNKELIGAKSMLETLKTALEKESKERKAQVQALESQLENETTARKNEDTALELRLYQTIAELKTQQARSRRVCYWAFGVAFALGGSPWVYILLHRG
jgi:septal ring factor EnvC (AmiA/AmiB activator)